MNVLFYIAAAVSVIATILVITRTNAVHALLYLIVSLFAVATMFFTLGAPFAAALEVIVYAGAIMVLFVFAIMLLVLGPESSAQERLLLAPTSWIGPIVLTSLLAVGIVFAVAQPMHDVAGSTGAESVGIALFGPYAIGVELASMLLLAGLAGAYHLGREWRT